HDVLHDLEARHVANSGSDPAPDLAHVDAVLVSRQLTGELRDIDVKILSQHLQQGRIEYGVVLVACQIGLGSCTSPLEFHRQKHQRRAIASLSLAGRRPTKHSEREEERVRAAFLEIRLRLTVKLDRALLEGVRLDVGDDLVALERLERKLHIEVFSCSQVIERLVGCRASPLPGRRANQADAFALSKLVFERGRVRAEYRYGCSRELEVQEAIALREIEQAPLPPVKALFRRLRAVFVGYQLDIEGRQVWRLVERRGRSARVRRSRCIDGITRDARERLDVATSGVPNVDRVNESVLVLLRDLPLRFFDSPRERHSMAAGRERGFEQQELVLSDGFADLHRILDRQGRQRLRLKPRSREGVTLREHDDGVEAGLLYRCSEQERRIEARGEAMLFDHRGEADLLALPFEARRRFRISQAATNDGGPDARDDLPASLS